MLSSRRGSFRSGGLRELAGSPKGLPPYCVGFIPHLEDGSLPGGFVVGILLVYYPSYILH